MLFNPFQPGVVPIRATRIVQRRFPHRLFEGRVGFMRYGFAAKGRSTWSAHVTKTTPRSLYGPGRVRRTERTVLRDRITRRESRHCPRG